MTDQQPTAPGWRDDPDGRRRWWDGQRWGAYAPWDAPGVGSTPESRAALARLDPSLTFDPTAAGRAQRAAGRDDREGPRQVSRAFLGNGAGEPSSAAAPTPRPAAPSRRMRIAYALLLTLGLLGGHRFYLGRVRSATAQMLLSFAAAATIVVLQGTPEPLLLALAVPAAAIVWWIADLFGTAGMVRDVERRGPDQR
ncbi:NINE protein [Agrococcus sp. Marseille-P2731]|uniref:NINE protein n=1 Tax=Agrococcus sp. Marseille-P2731 TaxID=1841862 RepID=UPI00093085EC|nr:NINE protein [Agrococcus sp. Marseille-P2731]